MRVDEVVENLLRDDLIDERKIFVYASAKKLLVV